MSNLTEGDEEEARLEEEQEAKLAELDAEMEKEKESRKLAGASEEEIQKALELLQRQHDAKRKVKFANKGLKGHITTPQGLDDTSMLIDVMLSALKWDWRCFLLLTFLSSFLSRRRQFWPLVSNVDPSSLMLAPCL